MTSETQGADGAGTKTAGDWRKVMRDLIAEHDKNVCLHEETRRGGLIWTICDHCGRKWADDQGGFQPYEEPAAVTAAWAALKCEATPAPAATPGVPVEVRARLQQAIDDFENEDADAHDMGDRPDLWDEVVEVPISDVREVLEAISAQPATPPGVPDSLRALRPEDLTDAHRRMAAQPGGQAGAARQTITVPSPFLVDTPAPNSTRTGAEELRCLINEVADAVFAIGRATLSEQQVDRAYTAAERLLDYRDRNLSAARPEAPSSRGGA